MTFKRGYKYLKADNSEFIAQILEDDDGIFLELSPKIWKTDNFRNLIKKVMPKVVKCKINEFELKGDGTNEPNKK